MAEAVAVVALTASIVTLVDLGTKVVSRLHDFAAQSLEIPASFRSLVDRIPLLIQTLQRIRARAQTGHVADDVARHLTALLDGLNDQINFLQERLTNLTPGPDASRFRKGLKALQSLAQDEKITQAVQKIHNGVDVLVLHQTTTNVDLSDRIIQELAELKLEKPPTPITTTAPAPAPPQQQQQRLGLRLAHAPQIDPDAFLGRVTELQQLDDLLSPISGRQPQRVVSIVGMGGIGKTQLSLAYARQYGNQFSSVFWLNAQDLLSLQQSLCSLEETTFGESKSATSKTDEEAQIKRIRDWLSESWNDKWLLIFDNYDSPSLPNIPSAGFDIRSFFPSRTHGSILITTRSPRLTFSRRLTLNRLDDGLALNILSHRAGRDLSNEIDAKTLIGRLGGLPLALTTAGTYIGQTGITCLDYLKLYEELWGDLHGPDSETLLEYADRSLSSTWVISLDCVGQQDADAVELLKFYALLNNDDIWYELVLAGTATKGPKWLDRVTSSKIRFHRAMSKLQDFSLVESVSGSYRVHPCIHDWLLEHHHETFDEPWLRAAACCVSGTIPSVLNPSYYMTVRRLALHTQRLFHERFNRLWESIVCENEVVDARDRLTELLFNLCQYQKVEQICLQTLAWKKKAWGERHKSTLKTMNSLGSVYHDQGKLAEAEQTLSQALRWAEEALDSADPTVMNLVGNLGNVYLQQSKPAEAEQMFLRVLKESSTTNRANIIAMELNLGRVYHDQGKLAQAEQQFYATLSATEEAFGPENLSTITLLVNLGSIYTKQGKLSEAERLCSQARKRTEEVLGLEHRLTVLAIANLASVFRLQERFEEAKHLFLQAMAGYEKLLGPEHTEVLRLFRALCNVYHQHEPFLEAERMYLQAIAQHKMALSENHEQTLELIFQLGTLYLLEGKSEEAQQMYARASAGFERTCGLDHPSFQQLVQSSAMLYRSRATSGVSSPRSQHDPSAHVSEPASESQVDHHGHDMPPSSFKMSADTKTG